MDWNAMWFRSGMPLLSSSSSRSFWFSGFWSCFAVTSFYDELLKRLVAVLVDVAYRGSASAAMTPSGVAWAPGLAQSDKVCG